MPKAFLFCDPAGARTQDPLIKSQVLYQLSYGIIFIMVALKLAPRTLPTKCRDALPTELRNLTDFPFKSGPFS